MTPTRKLWRAETVYLVKGREKTKTMEYPAPSEGAARQIALVLGATKINKIEEVKTPPEYE